VEDFPKSVDRQPSYVPNTYAEDNILSPEQVGGVEDFPKSVEHQPWYVPNTNAEDTPTQKILLLAGNWPVVRGLLVQTVVRRCRSS
jgi:hypothetical protein